MNTNRLRHMCSMSRLARSREDGFVMIYVIGLMVVLTIFVTGALVVAQNNVPASRNQQDYEAAYGAASAGINDYTHHLTVNNAYFQSPLPANSSGCLPASGCDPALATAGAWPTVPGTSNGATYHVAVISSPATPGVTNVTIRSSGKVGKKTRTLTATFSRGNFLQFLYFTDVEATDPALMNKNYGPTASFWTENVGLNSGGSFLANATGVHPYWYIPSGPNAGVHANVSVTGVALGYSPTTVQNACGTYTTTAAGHVLPNAPETYSYSYPNGASTVSNTYTGDMFYYGGNATNTSQMQNTGNYGNYSVSCNITFKTGDAINGPMHTNDSFLVTGHPVFNDTYDATTNAHGYQIEYSTAPDATHNWRSATSNWTNDSPTDTPNPQLPYLAQPVGLPTNITGQLTAAQTGGCVYTGPTKITFTGAANTVSVTSPETRAADNTDPNCGSWPSASTQTVKPGNKTIYVQNSTAGNPVCDNTELGYNLLTDTNSAQYGCLNGDAFVQGSVKTAWTVAAANDVIVTGNTTYSDATASSVDALGLVAQQYVQVYHPVNAAGSDLAGAAGGSNNIEIDAAIAAVSRSFIVQNYDQGPQEGNLTVKGAIVQKFRGPVGTGGGTGFTKNYSYDTRIRVVQPPNFLQPTSNAWEVSSQTE